jgi:ABC-type transport system involved in multi-copper enzyme maturation permease subunit
MLHPPDVGSEGKEVVDLEQEAQEVVGLVIQRDQFPDKLFAPPKRVDLLEDNANPVYDKEVHSEIFSQGTLMLRLVIQVSMFLAIPIMAVCLFMNPQWAPWYICYVVIFNVLVGPVFSAGSVTSERERQTLDLLLTTIITPWQILWGKLIAGLRVSSVLTMFLVWPVVLACLMVTAYWTNIVSVLAYVSIILLTCCTTAMIALFCSVVFRKTSMSLMTTYMVLILLFCAPLAIDYFAQNFFPQTSASEAIAQLGLISPFSSSFSVPLYVDRIDVGFGQASTSSAPLQQSWGLYGLYVAFTVTLNALLLGLMIWLFNARWRVSQ